MASGRSHRGSLVRGQVIGEGVGGRRRSEFLKARPCAGRGVLQGGGRRRLVHRGSYSLDLNVSTLNKDGATILSRESVSRLAPTADWTPSEPTACSCLPPCRHLLYNHQHEKGQSPA